MKGAIHQWSDVESVRRGGEGGRQGYLLEYLDTEDHLKVMTASKGFTYSLSSLVSEGHNSHKSVEKLALAQPYANFGETRMQLFRKAF